MVFQSGRRAQVLCLSVFVSLSLFVIGHLVSFSVI